MGRERQMTLEEQLIGHEGLKLKPYTDTVGKLTIGVGRNLTDVGISTDEARYLLENDITRTRTALLAALPWFSTLDDVRQRVLLDMGFNLGMTRLSGFTHMLAAVQAQDWDEAANQMLASHWADQVGERARTLATMMRTGQEA